MKSFLIVLLTVCRFLVAQQTEYEISFDNRAHHEARVTATFSKLPDRPAELWMSRSSPGRYAIHDFAKNAYGLTAVNGKNKPLTIVSVAPGNWQISGHDGTVKLTYTVFGDFCDGTYASFRSDAAHINMPAVFIWAAGLEEKPFTIRIRKPDKDWKIATQLFAKGNDTFGAPGLQYFMDSPIEVSAFMAPEWPVDGIRFRAIVHHDGSKADAEAFAAVLRAITGEAKAVFGEWPAYEENSYQFLFTLKDHADWDGMEHRNSTVITRRDSLRGDIVEISNTASHEFFHSWNVERIRPKSLEPFDFTRVNPSSELWFAEGFTNYYDDLILKRAGIMHLDRFAKETGTTLSRVINGPGRSFGGPAAMSRQASFADGGSSIDPVNRRNTFITYYYYGEVTALALDLTLRTRFNRSLDDYMRAMWVRFGKKEVPYTMSDLQTVLAEVSGDAKFADDFFKRYIEGSEVVDYEMLLAKAGLALRKTKPGKATLGAVAFSNDGKVTSFSNYTLIGTPLYQAGVDQGDEVLELDGRTVSSKSDWDAILASHTPGDSIELIYRKDQVRKTVMVRSIENQELELVPFEHLDRPLTPDMENFRKAWLSPRGTIPDLKRFCPFCHRAYAFENEFCPVDGAALDLTLRKP